MTPRPENGLPSKPNHNVTPGEDTLRLIANLPAPVGLENRIKTGLASAPGSARILTWRQPLSPARGWMYSTLARAAAAAAIVAIVAGGGWGIYSRVPPAPSADLISVPQLAAPQGAGFSSAGAKRVPETLEGPVLKHPVPPPTETNVLEKMPSSTKSLPGRSAIRKKTPRPRTAPVQ